MVDISLESVAGKLNRPAYEAFFMALRQAKSVGNRNVELAHWLVHLLQMDRLDIGLTVDHFKLDRAKLLDDLTRSVNGFRKNETEMPGFSNTIIDVLDRGWHYATLLFGETQIRTGHMLVGALKSNELRRAFHAASAELGKINVEELAAEYRSIWAGSEEENLRPMDGLRGSSLLAHREQQTQAVRGRPHSTAFRRT